MLLAVLNICISLFASPGKKGSVIGVWEGRYTCAQGITRVTLRLLEATPVRASAVFRFSADSSNPGVPTGCFSMRGGYDPKTGGLKLQGESWIQRPMGYSMIDFDGQLDPYGTTFTGRVIGSGCRNFHLERVGVSTSIEDRNCRLEADSPNVSRPAQEIHNQLQNEGKIDLDIAFEFGKSTLQSLAMEQLDELGRTLSRVDGKIYKIGIYGHTDAVGDPGANMSLSSARAEAVANYLVISFGINRQMLATGGLGATQLKNKMDAKSSENRRVEVRLFRLMENHP